MISTAHETKTEIERIIRAAFAAAAAVGELPDAAPADFTVEVPADTRNGDFATNAAMLSARPMRMAPAKIAAVLCAHMDFSGSRIGRCETAGPGFINFFVSQDWFADTVEEVLEKGADYGRSDYGRGEKVMVEFVSANPTGPMHMGNARGGAIGDCLAAALDWSGHKVTREFYINDAGNQIEKFGASLEARYLQLFLGEEAVPFPEDGYHGDDIRAHAAHFAAQYGDSYVSADSSARRQALVGYALPLNVGGIKHDLETYRITYDVWFRESSLHPDAIDEVITLLTDRDMTYKKDGALWYKSSLMAEKQAEKQGRPLTEEEKAGLKDDVLVRANGIPTYFVADIAYHYNKFVDRGFERVIDVWGADHHGHVARMKGAMDALGLEGDKLDVVLMQLVRLMKDGEPYRMSKRSGKAINLTDLLEEIPIDAARFFFNMREPGSTFDFDLDLAVSESSKNPVYYVQYAHARICSILKNLAAEGVAPRTARHEELCLLTAPEERELIRCLGQMPEEIIAAAKQYDPARLTKYVLDAATLFHKFYNSCRVKGEDEALMQARLSLCLAAQTVIRNCLNLLKITAPEVM